VTGPAHGIRGLAGAAGLAVLLAAASASAQAPAPATRAPAAADQAEVTGFRSARFGMTETEVRAAVAKDFKVKPADISVEENATEKTRALKVAVADLLPGGGRAMVAYLLGHRSQRLFQVNAVWSRETDDGMTVERLLADASLLTGYFQSAGYRPETIQSNVLVGAGSLLVFRGADAAGRTVQLLLHGSVQRDDKSHQSFTPQVLHLSYMQDPRNPDIFRLAPGQF